MRRYAEYKQILELWECCQNKKNIARITGIPRATVRDCIQRYGHVAGLEAAFDRKLTLVAKLQQNDPVENGLHPSYAYLLGMYLGDGSISQYPRAQRLRITLDKKYPNIIQECINAIEVLLPDNSVHTVNKPACVDVSCYYKYWDYVIPQHGVGKKHHRKIELAAWQQVIINTYPLELFRGLYHSDGSRFSNKVKGKDYPRYGFSNYSKDILRIFSDTCDKLGLHWTLAYGRNIFISHREDVAYLDQRVGPKS